MPKMVLLMALLGIVVGVFCSEQGWFLSRGCIVVNGKFGQKYRIYFDVRFGLRCGI